MLDGLRNWGYEKFKPWEKTYNSWTSRGEWNQWYEKSTLKSAVNTGTSFLSYKVELCPKWLRNAASHTGAFLNRTAKKVFIPGKEPAPEQKKAPKSSWFESVGTAFKKFFTSIWNFIKSPFICS